MEFLRLLHQAQRFAVTFGMCRTEITVHAFLEVASLFQTNNGHGLAVEFGNTADDGFIIGKTSVTMQFNKAAAENTGNIVNRGRSVIGSGRRYMIVGTH